MGAQVEGGLELIFLNQVPRFRIGTCLGGGLELLQSQEEVLLGY